MSTSRTREKADGELFKSTGIDDNAASNAVTINSSQQVGIGTDNMQIFNAGGGGSTLVVTAESNNTNVLANTGSNITIANGDGTADNTAALHFAREDTDGNPNYAGASVVSQFKETQVTGQYPKADLVFLTSTAANNAPSEKMRIDSGGTVLLGQTSNSFGSKGVRFRGDIGQITSTRDGGSPVALNRLSDDGSIIDFYKAGQLKGGINVSGTGISINLGGTAAANKLDDYETGSWNPLVTNSGVTATYNGYYTKIGEIVHIICVVNLSNDAGSSVMGISGLPFTSNKFAGGVCRESGATGVMYFAHTSASSTNIQINTEANGAISWGNTRTYSFDFTYRTSS